MAAHKTVTIETQRTTLTVLDQDSAHLMLRYYLENRDHLVQWEPARTQYFYTIECWQKLLVENQSMLKDGTAIKFSALNKAQTEVIGVCNFSNIVYGVFQACHLGYSVAEKYQGQGYMSEILKAATDYIFEEIGLHRIMANYVPGNTRSAAVLSRLGFEQEGMAKSYIQINGQWRDHILTSKINPKHTP